MMPAAAIFAYASAFFAGALAVAAAFRAHRSVPRWAFAAGMAVLAVESLCAGLAAAAIGTETALQWQTWKLVAASFIPGTWLLFSLSYARGNGRQFLTGGRVALAAAFLLPVVYFVFRTHTFAPPETVLAPPRLGWAGYGLYSLQLIAAVWVVMNLERTFRASVGTIRWRIKFMLLGVGVVFVTRIYTSSQVLVFRGFDPALDSIHSVALIAGAALMLRSFFRAGHFDLDVYPSQSVIQNSLTVLLAGVYLLIVGVSAKVVAYLGGDGAFALKAFVVLVSLVGLAVVLQSDRARLKLRRFVSRHFQRPLYDYRIVWKKFAEATASHVEQPDLCRSLAALVAEMFQALSVSLWMVNEKRDSLVLAASTSLRGTTGSGVHTPAIDASDVILRFETSPEPVDIESVEASWAARLRQCHPEEFPNGGNRICVPMIGRGELLGVIIIGDRVSGTPFSLQDLDLLKCVGDHGAASLMNVQLSQRLLQAKELEAFQAMAAFFVHDLKNAASTLNLTLQNLPLHFDDPLFRADALRGIGKSVAHVNGLISRLGLLRHELKTELTPGDLNEVVDDALAALEPASVSVILKEINPLPLIPLDRDQLHKVITNLVLNATEAVAGKGRVRVTTARENDWVVLTVEDDGCGMTEDFINRSLFRPFHTTKKSGLGIGLFQSKMIVETHGGRLTVSSQQGKGTVFRVFLPLAGGSIGSRQKSSSPTWSSNSRSHETQVAHR